jgi:digalactosyldiacylglycerol synthase
MNVHGVSPVFLEVGRRKATAAAQASAAENDPDAAAAQAVGRTVGRALASLGARAERREERRRKKSETKAGKDVSHLDDAPTPEAIHPSREVFNKGCYFLGKVVWGKGFHELLQRVEEHNKSEDGASFPLELDVFGSGEDFSDVSRTSAAKNLPLTFKGRADHASDQMHDYKVFVNPSLSDVVATTTAEALAMGKYVIVAEHPSNAFFATFPNCLVYRDPGEFSACVKKALSSEPAPLTTRDRYRLSWEAATDRFLDAAELGAEQSVGPGSTSADKMAEKMAHFVHSAAAKVEPLRRAAGAGAATRVGPTTVDGKWTPPWVKTG